jgi:hypothetical protein
MFGLVANELRSNDIYLEGANSYGDYRKDLLRWADCEVLLEDFCSDVGLPSNAKKFVQELKQKLLEVASFVDNLYPELSELIISDDGVPTLKCKRQKIQKSNDLLNEIKLRMPERNLVDILCNSHQYTGWADAFGPISGMEPKMENAVERYIIDTFGNGTGMGPVQTAKHVKANVTPHILSWMNRRHVSSKNLDASLIKLINYSNSFHITKAFGDEKRCAADGTFRNIYEDNLIS